MTHALSMLGLALIAAGSFFVVVGCIGLVRMPDLFTRMHAASVTDTFGAGLLVVGMMLVAGASLVSVKLAMLGLLIFFTSPTASHALARAALARGIPLLATAEEQRSSKP